VSAPDLVDSLARLALFDDLGRPELEALAAGVETVEVPEGQWVLRAGDENSALYVIVEGEVGIVIDDEERAVSGRGSFFGEISALLDEPVTAGIVTRTAVRCIVIPRDELERFLVANPRVMFRVLQAEARRLRGAAPSRT
jgi:CRP/FNR family cyclic AMP-dependent transcriptional regulator